MRLTGPDVQNPQLILIVGSVGLALNMLVLSFLHGKRTTPPPPFGNMLELLTSRFQSTTTSTADRDMGTKNSTALLMGDSMRFPGHWLTMQLSRPRRA